MPEKKKKKKKTKRNRGMKNIGTEVYWKIYINHYLILLFSSSWTLPKLSPKGSHFFFQQGMWCTNPILNSCEPTHVSWWPSEKELPIDCSWAIYKPLGMTALRLTMSYVSSHSCTFIIFPNTEEWKLWMWHFAVS